MWRMCTPLFADVSTVTLAREVLQKTRGQLGVSLLKSNARVLLCPQGRLVFPEALR